jgi:transposase
MEPNAKIAEMEQKIQSLETTVASQVELISKQDALIKYYEEQFKLSQRRQFGPSSEQSPNQLRFDTMFNEAEDQADPSLPEPLYEEITYRRKKRVGKREEDLAGLPVERVDYELPESERLCPDCGNLMDDIGATVRNELVIIPAKVFNRQHATHAYACGRCEKAGEHTPIVKAAAPKPLISGSLASPSAVAHIATQKYVNGVPLYRTEKGLSYDGVVLSRQTMSNWLVYCAKNCLLPIYLLLIAFLRKEDVAHADETTVQVLHEPGRAAQTKSYMWLYRTSGSSGYRIVVYEYTETRQQDHPRRFLKDYKGFLHTDGYQAYHNLPPGIIVVGCWSHMRRYWEKLYETIPKDGRDGSNAERGLVYCNLLFAFEHEFRDLPPEERHQKRLQYSKPASDDYFEWVASLNALPKSLMGDAVHYAMAQREHLENVYLDGRLELSNNRAERSIKPFVQGRKQWLFSCTPNGADASAIYYSIIETAKENLLNPYQYLKHLLEATSNRDNDTNLEDLLPWSGSLPDICRTPIKASKNKTEKPMYFQGKGPLYQALLKLREKYGNNKPDVALI